MTHKAKEFFDKHGSCLYDDATSNSFWVAAEEAAQRIPSGAYIFKDGSRITPDPMSGSVTVCGPSGAKEGVLDSPSVPLLSKWKSMFAKKEPDAPVPQKMRF